MRQAAATAYIEIILKESDNNVKLIVLDRLVALKEHPSHERVLQELVMDVLRILATPDLEVSKHSQHSYQYAHRDKRDISYMLNSALEFCLVRSGEKIR